MYRDQADTTINTEEVGFKSIDIKNYFDQVCEANNLKPINIDNDALELLSSHVNESVITILNQATLKSADIDEKVILKVARETGSELYSAYKSSDLSVLENGAPLTFENTLAKTPIQQITHDKLVNQLYNAECDILNQILN